jgi:CBS domain-containing protein
MPKVRDILAKKGQTVHTIEPEMMVLEATRLMNLERIGALVVRQNEHVVGIFTERDVLVRIVAAGLDPASVQVADVLTTPVAYCTPDTTIEQCSAIFTEKRIRHLPVMDGDTLVGIVTIGDILAFDAEKSRVTIQYLEEYIRS